MIGSDELVQSAAILRRYTERIFTVRFFLTTSSSCNFSPAAAAASATSFVRHSGQIDILVWAADNDGGGNAAELCSAAHLNSDSAAAASLKPKWRQGICGAIGLHNGFLWPWMFSSR
ncbi:hypothetical protein TYRP_003965 [Tyrophagus putrescentiae]|nr:hypothetical protein TYRP_003965 [Tyrophagus putrescentiae]